MKFFLLTMILRRAVFNREHAALDLVAQFKWIAVR